jgi:phosphatidylethanolamine N-methyltransferase
LLSTPTATEGETATDSDALDTEIEIDLDGKINDNGMVSAANSGTFTPPKRTATSGDREMRRFKEHGVSQHDLFNKYFRRDTVLLHNIDLFR